MQRQARSMAEHFLRRISESSRRNMEKGPYMQDMYSAGFYPYPDEESYWGYWSKQAILGGIDLDVTPLHKTFLSMFSGKKIFVLSTNADGQFVKSRVAGRSDLLHTGRLFPYSVRKRLS